MASFTVLAGRCGKDLVRETEARLPDPIVSHREEGCKKLVGVNEDKYSISPSVG